MLLTLLMSGFKFGEFRTATTSGIFRQITSQNSFERQGSKPLKLSRKFLTELSLFLKKCEKLLLLLLVLICVITLGSRKSPKIFEI